MSLPGCNEGEVGARVHRDAVHVHLTEGFVVGKAKAIDVFYSLLRVSSIAAVMRDLLSKTVQKKAQHLLQDNRSAHHTDASNEKESGWTVEVVNPTWYRLLHIDLA